MATWYTPDQPTPTLHEEGGDDLLDDTAALVAAKGDRALLVAPTGAKAVTFDRLTPAGSATAGLPTVGTSLVTQLPCTKSVTVSNVKLRTGTTAASGTGGNVYQWAAILSSTGTVLAVTANQALTAMAASTDFTWALGASLDLTADTRYYVELLISMNTQMPTMTGAPTNATLNTSPPVISGAGAAGNTTPPTVGAQRNLPGATPLFIPYVWLT